MADLETKLNGYIESINKLDARLSLQMVTYQEELSQMQADLETGLNHMAEAIANEKSDEIGVKNLTVKFKNLHMDIKNFQVGQNNNKKYQDSLFEDMTKLSEKVIAIRNDKSDRSEISEAMEHLVGTSLISTYVSCDQFGSVQGSLQNRILNMFDLINGVELSWQTSLVELSKSLANNSEITQLEALRYDINRHVETLKERVQAMSDLVGSKLKEEAKDIYHKDPCLSCYTEGVE